jgi:hypothetical protein
MDRRILLAWVLRLVGAVEALAFIAVVMPSAWMQAGHDWLGVAQMPEGPVFDSVMRQVSWVYGLHGVALWVMAADVVRYRPLVILAAVGFLASGPVFILIDTLAGMPWFYAAGNGGSCLLIGGLLSALLWGGRGAG